MNDRRVLALLCFLFSCPVVARAQVITVEKVGDRTFSVPARRAVSRTVVYATTGTLTFLWA